MKFPKTRKKYSYIILFSYLSYFNLVLLVI